MGLTMAFAPGARAQDKPLVDSVRPYLVFTPKKETWFVAANRGKRMVLDIGRVDLEIRRDSTLAEAYRDAVGGSSPFPLGTAFTLRGPWGTEQVRAGAIDSWNGRIVLVLEGSAAMDSAAQSRGDVIASAERLPLTGPVQRRNAADGATARVRSASVAVASTCDRAADPGVAPARITAIRDSLEGALRAAGLPIYERLAHRVTASSSHVMGCFGESRIALAVSLRVPGNEWVRERVVMVDRFGRVQEIVVDDFRFQVHDLLHAFDADGDGIDDIVAVGRTMLAGGTTILRYDPAAKRKRLVRLAAGFSWENR